MLLQALQSVSVRSQEDDTDHVSLRALGKNPVTKQQKSHLSRRAVVRREMEDSFT